MAKLRSPALLAPVKQHLLPRIGQLGRTAAVLWAPVDTGRLRASLTVHQQANHVAWGTNVPYGRDLDQPHRRGEPTYRRGPHKGEPTRSWLTRTREIVRKQLRPLLRETEQAIQREWRR